MTNFEMLRVFDTSHRGKRGGTRPVMERVLDWLGLDRKVVEAMTGDITEELAERTAGDGAVLARLWYVREILRSTPHIIAAVIRRGGTPARRLVALAVVIGLALATALTALQVLRVGDPARLVSDLADEADAILLNDTRPVQLRMRVLDDHGRSIENKPVRFARVSGAPIAVSSTGVVTCEQPGDAVVHASLGEIVTQLAIRCRPVKEIRASAWVDLVAGGEPSDLPFEAIGTDEQQVKELRGVARVVDTSIAVLNGLAVRPRSPGATMVSLEAGDSRSGIRVIVHEPVASFVGLRPEQRFVGIPVRLAQGDTVRWALPRGTFWLKYIPARLGEAPPTIVLRGSANCSNGNGLRVLFVSMDVFAKYCIAFGPDAVVEVAHGRVGAAVVEGFLALDRVD